MKPRDCRLCGRFVPGGDSEQPDPCLGLLPGVKYACCGHGEPAGGYIYFENGVTIRAPSFLVDDVTALRRDGGGYSHPEWYKRMRAALSEPAESEPCRG